VTDRKPEIRRRLHSLQLTTASEEAIVDELAQHLDDYFTELLAGGATEEEAYGWTADRRERNRSVDFYSGSIVIDDCRFASLLDSGAAGGAGGSDGGVAM
jgi:hypothetical protein